MAAHTFRILVFALFFTNIVALADVSSSAHFLSTFKFHEQSEIQGTIAFSAKIEQYEKIIELNIQSGTLKTLAEGPYNNTFPKWSPDGSSLAFASDREGRWQIYVLDTVSNAVRKVTESNSNDEDPDWSPDGTEVVFSSDRDSPRGKSAPDSELYAVSLSEPSKVRRLTQEGGRNTTPRWSPDGKTIAFSTDRFWPGWDICLLDSRTLTESCPIKGVKTNCRPGWSSDSKSLLISYGILSRIDIAQFGLSSKELTILTSLPKREYDAQSSSDGRSVVFAAENNEGTFNLYFLDGNRQHRPLLESPYSLRFPSWKSP